LETRASLGPSSSREDVIEVDIDGLGTRGAGGVGKARAVESTGLGTVGSSIALLASILNTIATTREKTVASASVGSIVGVGRAIITLLISFSDAITALGVDFQVRNRSAISGLEASSIVAHHFRKLAQLASADRAGSGKHEPVG